MLAHVHLKVNRVFALNVSDRDPASANPVWVFAFGRAYATQFFETDGEHIYVDVDAVEQVTGDAADVTLDLQRRATPFMRRAIPEAKS